MPYYNWLGINTKGKLLSSTNQAKNRKQLKKDLEKQNVLLLKIKLNFKTTIKSYANIPAKHIIYLIEQLSILVNANTPIIKAFSIINQDITNPKLKNLITSCKNSIAEGKPLYKTLQQYPQYFTDFICNIIYVGEQSGTLDIMLSELANYLKKQQIQNRKIINALLYPLCIVIVTLITTSILLIFVIPQFDLMFKSLGAKLPSYTVHIINLGAFLQRAWPFILGSMVMIIAGMKIGYKHLKQFRIFIDKLTLKIPIVKNILSYTIIFRFTKTLSLTFKLGVPLLEALNISATTITHSQYRLAIKKAAELIINGKSLYGALIEQNLFPKTVTELIALGEETGSLDQVLEKISVSYHEKLTTFSDNLNSLLEPIIMLILGIIVSGIVIGMYLPIFRLGTII